MGTANTSNLLNQSTDWTNSQPKKLTLTAHPDARVWVGIDNSTPSEISGFTGSHEVTLGTPGTTGLWVEWNTLAILEGQGEGAGSPPANPLASPDAKAEKHGAAWVPPQDETLEYDDAGNRQANSLWDYGWDAKNQLVRARTKNHLTAPQAYDIQFVYDAEGRRVSKQVVEYRSGSIVSQKVITFVWDGWDLVYERQQLPSGLTTLERKYLWGPDIADGAAGGAGGLLLIQETKGNATQKIIPLYDGTGHVTALTNLNKELLASYTYGPFGENISATGPMANSNPWRWGTKYFDEETGIYYFGKRYYDPLTGQWLSREPLGESESVNLYSYCHNDPVNRVDVLGLFETQLQVDSLRTDLLLGQLLRDPTKLPLGPPEEALDILNKFPNADKFGLSKAYGQEDYQRAETFVQNLGRPFMKSMTWEEAEAAKQPSFGPAPEWIPSATAALTLGAANTPLNAQINSDWLLPTGAGAAGAKFAFGGFKAALPLLTRAAGLESRVFATELRVAEGVAPGAGTPLLSTHLSKNIRAYASEVQTLTGYGLRGDQSNKLVAALRATDYTQSLSAVKKAAHRRAFSSQKGKLISQWEAQTGQKWPRYGVDAPAGRELGDLWDAHELIPNKHGGPLEWWNITPARYPDQHQGGIHAAGSALRILLNGL
jgi:RHS repeat-associated protein